MTSSVADVAGVRGVPRPRRGRALFLLYPLLGLALALFVAYPLVLLLAQAVLADGAPSLATLAGLLADPATRSVLWNTVLLGLSVAVAGTILATLYAYAITRVAMPGKGFFHFVALLPTISPPILIFRIFADLM